MTNTKHNPKPMMRGPMGRGHGMRGAAKKPKISTAQ